MKSLKNNHINPIISDLKNQNEFLKNENKHLLNRINELNDELKKLRNKWQMTFVYSGNAPDVSVKFERR